MEGLCRRRRCDGIEAACGNLGYTLGGEELGVPATTPYNAPRDRGKLISVPVKREPEEMSVVSVKEAVAASQGWVTLRASALRRVRTVLVGILLIVAAAVPARGGEVFLRDINGNDSGWKATWDPTLDPFVKIVADMVTASAVFIHKTAVFTQGPGPGGFSTIPIAFSQVSANAVTQIIISGETITNDTGVAWTDFHFRLLDHGNATFNPMLTDASGGGTGFSTAPFNNQMFSPDNTSFWVDGFGLEPGGGNASVEDGVQWSPGDGAGEGELVIDVVPESSEPFTVFTLKETPSIPEPATLWLAAFGAAVLVPRRRLR